MKPPTTVYRGERVFDGQVFQGVRVTVDGRPLDPRQSWKLRDHSPTGFEWGYGGAGPAQLALALLFDATGDKDRALAAYQYFKWAAVACWLKDTWEITAGEVLAWEEQFERESRSIDRHRAADQPDAVVGEGGDL